MNKKRLLGNLLILLRIVLLILFGWYYTSLSVFNHAHVIQGRVITHSHPFKQDNSGTPFKNHRHSNGSFILFAKSAGGEALPLDLDVHSEPGVLLLSSKKVTPFSEFFLICSISSNPLRAPPLA